MTVSCLGSMQSGDDTPSLSDYTTADALTAPETLPVPRIKGRWEMLANQQIADCALAAAGHAVKLWAAPHAANPPVEQAALTQAYTDIRTTVRAQRPDSNGITALDALKYWRTQGLSGHQIVAYAGIEYQGDPAWVKGAVSAFGCAYVVLSLPDGVVRKNVKPESAPWNKVPTGKSAHVTRGNDHCVIYVAYDDQLTLSAVTWGEVKPVSWNFHHLYCTEMYVALDPSWKVPKGVNVKKWKKDIANL